MSRSTGCPTLAAIVDEVGRDDVDRVVIRSPLVHPKSTRYGDVAGPDLARIQAIAAELFSEPGTAPIPWPTPKPTKAPKATADAATPALGRLRARP